MSAQAADGAALVAAAVQAAIRENAPRRTVAAVAAAVAGTVLQQRPTSSATRARARPDDAQSAGLDAGNPDQLLASLRAARRAQRARKKERRKLAKQAAMESTASLTGMNSTQNDEAKEALLLVNDSGVADPSTGVKGTLVAASAQTPGALAADTLSTLPAGASPQLPSTTEAKDEDVNSSVSAKTLGRSLHTASHRGSEAHSAGRFRSEPYATVDSSRRGKSPRRGGR